MLASNQTEDEEVCEKNKVSAIERKTSKLDARSSCDIRVSTDKSRISARGVVWEDIKHIALKPEFVKSKVFVRALTVISNICVGVNDRRRIREYQEYD